MATYQLSEPDSRIWDLFRASCPPGKTNQVLQQMIRARVLAYYSEGLIHKQFEGDDDLDAYLDAYQELSNDDELTSGFSADVADAVTKGEGDTDETS